MVAQLASVKEASRSICTPETVTGRHGHWVGSHLQHHRLCSHQLEAWGRHKQFQTPKLQLDGHERIYPAQDILSIMNGSACEL